MNQGPLIFLGVFFALVASWFGLIVQPQLQIGGALQSTNIVDTTQLYPQPRPGQAQQGLQVYRSLGCATCHSQQVQQQGTVFDLVLASAGTNAADVIKGVLELRPGTTAPEAAKLVEKAPVLVLEHQVNRRDVEAAAAKLTASGAKVEIRIIPMGPDILRGWGVARSVGADYLYDQPVLLGSQRIGPDLANVGARLSDADWHFRHFYSPRSLVPTSVMPPYRFLFEKRKVGAAAGEAARHPANNAAAVIAGSRTNFVRPEALALSGEVAPEDGYEIVPTDQARALVAYLLSLRADTPLLERPLSAASQPSGGATSATNAAVNSATNAPTR
jgi:cytochrome c oxidase cbb3-type subunit 2